MGPSCLRIDQALALVLALVLGAEHCCSNGLVLLVAYLLSQVGSDMVNQMVSLNTRRII
jgi:hypothetical protein